MDQNTYFGILIQKENTGLDIYIIEVQYNYFRNVSTP